jgi:hypothetical protein
MSQTESIFIAKYIAKGCNKSHIITQHILSLEYLSILNRPFFGQMLYNYFRYVTFPYIANCKSMKDISSIDYNKEYIGNITDVKEYNQM